MSREGKAGKRNRKKKKVKLNLVFDEDKRREFLSGFRKRNLEKKRKKAEELETLLKEERKRIKQEAKDSFKKLVVTNRPIPGLEEFPTREFETEKATVKITELSTVEMSKCNLWIGPNRPGRAEDDDDEESDESGADSPVEELPGMEPVAMKTKKKAKAKIVTEAAGNISKREVQKIIKNQATHAVQKSKTFQLKNKMERMKNKKKSSRLKSRRMATKGGKKAKTKNKSKRQKGS